MQKLQRPTEAEAERLVFLAEEASEIVHVAMKILRHGYEAQFPANSPTYRTKLETELCDLQGVLQGMVKAGDVSLPGEIDQTLAWHKKLWWSNHQPEKLRDMKRPGWNGPEVY